MFNNSQELQKENEMTWRDSATKLKMAKKQLMVPATMGDQKQLPFPYRTSRRVPSHSFHLCNPKQWVLIEDATKSKSSDDFVVKGSSMPQYCWKGLRNKRLMFVGDSLNRGQWVSMVCLVDSVIPTGLQSMHQYRNGSLHIFKAIMKQSQQELRCRVGLRRQIKVLVRKGVGSNPTLNKQEYNATIEFYWSPLLVESNSDDPSSGIEKHARHWTDADILVFNSYLWWRRAQMTVLWGSFESPDGVYRKVEMPRVYEMALKTWSDCCELTTYLIWIEIINNIRMCFRALEWGGAEGQNCYNETEQIFTEGYRGQASCQQIMRAVEKTLDDLKKRGLNVQMINITQLSEHRKEGHPSVYRKQWEPLKEEQISNPSSYADCVNVGRAEAFRPHAPLWRHVQQNQEVKNIHLASHGMSLHVLHLMVGHVASHGGLKCPDCQSKCFSRLQAKVLGVCSILYNESSIQQIHEEDPSNQGPKHQQHATTVTYVVPNLGSHSNLAPGKWVFDSESYPLYNESDCPYMSDQLACHKHGRSDLGISIGECSWKCFEAMETLEFQICLLPVAFSLGVESVIPADKRSMSPNAPLTIFRAEEYNAPIEFFCRPLLVDSNSDDPVNHRLDERIMRPDSVLKHSSKWEHADILVFNSYLWWRQGPVKLSWSAEENGACEELDGLGAMELAMGAWADWVASKTDPQKKRVFFVTMSPTHLWSREWGPGSDGNCYGEKKPIDWEGYWGSGSDMPTMRMVEKVLSRLGSKVSVLNITQLSEYRKDGHPSIYRKFWETLSPKQLSNPKSYSDCIHWCLPGLPDVWNELLFHFL
uniref:Uncharacterized protein n=1 Tax=Salix viminalis TaxID=40686 RepID=A0A6N2MYT8_SALVM